MPLIEIIKTKYTSEEAVATAYQLALNLGKIPIVVNDGPGFLTTRLFAVYCVEASRLALEGVPFEVSFFFVMYINVIGSR
jgi:3-hydroxyacyl-CoA dehydrogenase/enoyl-CoA hydratase/3-hydroxybutyryl-CoA epimerase